MTVRYEEQPWNQITARFEAVSAGSGVTGLSPAVRIQRVSDDMYWNDGTGAWEAPLPSDATAAAIANMDGLYEYSFDPIQAPADYAAGLEGYRIRVEEASVVALEHTFVMPRARKWMLEPFNTADWMSDNTSMGWYFTAGIGVAGKLLMRVKPTTFDVDGRLEGWQDVLYPTTADTDADTNAMVTLNGVATYDGSGNLATFRQRE